MGTGAAVTGMAKMAVARAKVGEATAAMVAARKAWGEELEEADMAAVDARKDKAEIVGKSLGYGQQIRGGRSRSLGRASRP